MNIIENPGGLESPIESFLQTDAAVNSGNSGGALVNAEAKLIGIITAIASGNGNYIGYSFAIPSNLASKVASDLRRYGYVQRAYLGVNVLELTPRMASELGSDQTKGLYIARMAQTGAAATAGMTTGDIITEIEGVEVSTFAEMMEELGRFSPGDVIKVKYIRNNRANTVMVTLLNLKGTTAIVRK